MAHMRSGIGLLVLMAPAALAAEELMLDSATQHEHCLRAKAGQTLGYRFQASAALRFNLHYHEGRRVRYPVPLKTVADDAGTVPVKTASEYCLMWRNAGPQAARLKFSLELK